MKSNTQEEFVYKEAFRKQAIAHGVGDDCVIDKDGYAEVSNIVGCFKLEDEWIVYNTDERGERCNEKKYQTPKEAYIETALRLDFVFI